MHAPSHGCAHCQLPPPPTPALPTDLGGSVTAALAASSILFRAQKQTDYAAQLLAKAQEVGRLVG